jgi:FkbM family methyltransferase
MALSRIRLIVQSSIKRLGRAAGVEIRYAFQYPSISDPAIYAPWLDVRDVRCVFDVGANVGQSARRFAQAFPCCQIYSFEPFPAAYRRLSRVADASLGRIKAYGIACGDTDGYVESHIEPTSVSQLNKIHDVSPRSHSSPRNKLAIEVKRVDTVCAEQGVESIDVLKTDTEGFDARVLAGAAGMLSAGRIRCIVSEVGFLDDQQHTPFADVFTLLSTHGFELAGIYEITYLRNGKCDYANALFTRR